MSQKERQKPVMTNEQLDALLAEIHALAWEEESQRKSGTVSKETTYNIFNAEQKIRDEFTIQHALTAELIKKNAEFAETSPYEFEWMERHNKETDELRASIQLANQTIESQNNAYSALFKDFLDKSSMAIHFSELLQRCYHQLMKTQSSTLECQ